MTKMACGARDLGIIKNGLSMKVGKRMTWIEVTLDASDTYTVELIKITRKAGKRVRVVAKSMSGIYCDMLSETVYGMVNT